MRSLIDVGIGQIFGLALILAQNYASAADSANSAIFEEVYPTLLIAISKTSNSNFDTNIKLREFSKSLTKLSNAAAAGTIEVGGDLRTVVEEYKRRLQEIIVSGDSSEAENTARQLYEDAGLKAAFLDQSGPGLFEYVRMIRVAIQIRAKNCSANSFEMGYDVTAVPELLEVRGIWTAFSGPTDSAFADLNPGRWRIKIKGRGLEKVWGPYSIGVVGAPKSIDICVNQK